MRGALESLRQLTEALDNTLLHHGERMPPSDLLSRRLLVEEGRIAAERLERVVRYITELERVMAKNEEPPTGADYNNVLTLLGIGT